MSKHPSSPTAEAWESGVTRRPSRLKGRAGFGVSEAERLEGVSSNVHDHKRLGGVSGKSRSLEAGMISARTKAALTAAKRRDVKLGGDRGARLSESGRKEPPYRSECAIARLDLAPTIQELQATGCGFPTPHVPRLRVRERGNIKSITQWCGVTLSPLCLSLLDQF